MGLLIFGLTNAVDVDHLYALHAIHEENQPLSSDACEKDDTKWSIQTEKWTEMERETDPGKFFPTPTRLVSVAP